MVINEDICIYINIITIKLIFNGIHNPGPSGIQEYIGGSLLKRQR